MDTSVDYLGLKLKTPLVVGSCGLSDGLEALRAMEEAGAGAVVLKSRFEEEFAYDIKRNSSVVARTNVYGTSFDYVASHLGDYAMDDYFAYVAEAARSLSIPVIGSVNCFQLENWVSYVQRYAQAGCAALELKIALRPYDSSVTAFDVERVYTQVLQAVRRATQLPIIVKMSCYFTDLAKFMQQLPWYGVKGVTLFDYDGDVTVDIDNLCLTPRKPEDVREDSEEALRWIAILSGKVRADLAAATGINDWADVVRSLLVGARSVHLSSCLSRNGIAYIREVQKGLEDWMLRQGFDNIGQFCGRLAMSSHENASSVLRVRNMKAAFEAGEQD